MDVPERGSPEMIMMGRLPLVFLFDREKSLFMAISSILYRMSP
jgi:hypothetical protein